MPGFDPEAFGEALWKLRDRYPGETASQLADRIQRGEVTVRAYDDRGGGGGLAPPGEREWRLAMRDQAADPAGE